MWLMTTDGFYSAIRWHDGRMCVRARDRLSLTRLRKKFPELSKVQVTPGKDYRYRCFCTPKQFERIAAGLAREIDYGNFKTEAGRRRGVGSDYVHALHAVWNIFGKTQPGGPYGYGDRAGFPPIPKNEPKGAGASRIVQARSFSDTPKRDWERHVNGDVCDECGHELEPGEADLLGGLTLCRDVSACVARSS